MDFLNNKFYQQTLSEVFKAFDSSEHGLSPEAVAKNVKQYGLNKLPDLKPDSLLKVFSRQFKSPLIYILLVACLIIFLMGDLVDGVVILLVLVFNAIVGTVQEGKAQNTLLALKKFIETRATVLRDGKEIIISDHDVVPGDIILLQEGEKVPADARVILSSNLKIDEASLTGESEPVEKFSETILSDKDLPTTDQSNMVFRGTNVLVGNGRAIVVATALDTVIGKISKEISLVDTEMPLKKNIRYLSRLIIGTVLVFSVVLFILGIYTGQTAKEMFGTVVSLAVSIIPEGLPIVMTLVLATGVWRMSKQNALVKKLQAVESLGQARVIAVDKTGTITKNEMIVQQVYLPGSEEAGGDKMFMVGGVGYESKGDVHFNDKLIDPVNHPELIFASKVGILCANAQVIFSEKEKIWRVIGDPTEAAMLVLAQKFGFYKEDILHESPFVEEVPFDYKLKCHATVHQTDKVKILSVAGAPEEILRVSDSIWLDGKAKKLSIEERKKLESVYIGMSEQGLRVIALAIDNNFTGSVKKEKIKDLSFVGFLGMKDALRPEVNSAMATAVSAGIKVIMITGDHIITAQAIAREAGIFKTGDIVLTGADIDNLSDEVLTGKLSKTSVFARVTPEHKLRIINLYKKRGEIVAMTGDGVNDAPSLVAADLGVAMGKIGTEVAKEAADIVLTDDNFGSIISAVEEGRSIYKTIKKVILYLFSTSWGEALTITGALLVGLPLPLLPAQIIWLNFVTDGFLDVSLAMEPKEEGLMKRNFERPKNYLLDKLMIQRMLVMSVPMMLGTLLLFSLYLDSGLIKAWTMALTTLAVFQWFNAWNCRHESRSIFQTNFWANKFLVIASVIVIGLQIFLVYNPFMQSVFKTTSLTILEWLLILVVSSSIIIVEEVRKFFYRRKNV